MSVREPERGLHRTCLTTEWHQCSELFRVAQHCEIGCRFLKRARRHKNREPSAFWSADDTLASTSPQNHRDESEFTPRIVTCNFFYLNEDQPWLTYFTPPLPSRRFVSSAVSGTLMQYLTVSHCQCQCIEVQYFATRYSAVQNKFIISVRDIEVDILWH